MAIYHLSAQIISRSDGRSSVAAAAYRAGEELLDERTGIEHDYTKRNMEIECEILAPSNAPDWIYEREKLWNEVETVEKRKDAQLSREINVALPVELSKDQNRELIKDYVRENFVDSGMVADLSIHWAKDNPHAHVMLTTREVNEDGFGKKNREWNDKELLESWREGWARSANQALAQANVHEQISHKTLKEQGIDREPQIHLGSAVIAMEKRGIETERGDIYRQIEEVNKKSLEIQECLRDKEKLISEKNLGLGYDLSKEERSKLLVVRERFNDVEFSRDGLIEQLPKVDETQKYLKEKINATDDRLRSECRLKGKIEKLHDGESEMKKYSLVDKVLKRSDYIKIKEDVNVQREHLKSVCGGKIPSLDSIDEKIQIYGVEKQGLEKGIEFVGSSKEKLRDAVEIMEGAEKRCILKNYPEEFNRISYEDAKVLELYGSKFGKVESFNELKNHYDGLSKEYNDILGNIRDIESKERNIKNAQPLLDKYLKDKANLEKLEKAFFKFGKGYREKLSEAKENFRVSDGRYKDCQKIIGEKFSTKKELLDINDRHSYEVSRIPDMRKQVENIKPDLKFVGDLFRAVNRSVSAIDNQNSLDKAIERARETIKKMEANKGKGRDRDDGWERELDRGRGR